MNLKQLHVAFGDEDIEWRIQQSGKTNKIWALVVPYVTNRAIMDRLDEVCGPQNWKNEFRSGPNGGLICTLLIRVDDEWIGKEDGADNTDIEAVKGGLSNAMKRAAVQWGIGRFLYDLPEAWATVSDTGKNRAKLKDGTRFRWDPPRLFSLGKGEENKPNLPKSLTLTCPSCKQIGVNLKPGKTGYGYLCNRFPDCKGFYTVAEAQEESRIA